VSPHPITELRRYDPNVIARYYQRRPWKAVWRAMTVVWYFAGFLLGMLWDKWFGQDRENRLQRAAQLRDIFTHLGPTFIKVGQALSTRPDLVHPDFLEELIKLQDRLPAFDRNIAMQLIETEIGKSVEDAYSEISPDPIAAASLAQVYKARLYSGEEVAVKVQRPNLKPIITLDLFLMRWAAVNFGGLLPLNLGHDLDLIVDEFGCKLFEEIDYLNEGRNAEKFAANFSNNPKIKIPEIYWRYSNTRVLTMEWINGCKLTGAKELQAAGIDPNEIIETAVISGLQQLLEYGFFHADPHPGNLFAMSDGRMAYIDFGMMDQLEEWMKETLVDALVHLINQEYEAMAKDFVKLGFLTPDTDIAPIVPAFESVLGDIMGQSVGEFNLKTVTDRFSELMYEYPFRVPAKFALIIRSVVTQEGIALSIDPNFKIVDMGYPYIAQRLLQGESPQLRRRLIDVLFKDGKFQWQRLENLIAIAQTGDNFDLLPTAQLGLQYLMSEEGKYLRRQLLLALTEDDRLHAAEVQRLWDLVKADLQPDRLWTVALEAITDFSSQRAAELFPSMATLTSFNNSQ
jgi:predicted unusual protein kinase regulating ubiquinone biosynthesis (AarF/ABC1/UbiB family)